MGERMNAVKEFLFENILQISVNYGAEMAKEVAQQAALEATSEMGVNVLIDTTSSMIPAVGPAITSFRNNKRMKNTELLLKELNKRQEDLQRKFEDQSQSNKEILDDIFEMVIEKISHTMQEEKIRYMVNGYSDLLELENPSFDTAYLYFDTLDKLTILDIETLKLSYPLSSEMQKSGEWPSTFSDILEKFDIDYSQYTAVRENLYRFGLLENDYDDKLDKDLENIIKAIKDIRGVTESLVDAWSSKKTPKIKKLSSKSQVKLKAKDRLKISKFGRNFIGFFIENKET